MISCAAAAAELAARIPRTRDEMFHSAAAQEMLERRRETILQIWDAKFGNFSRRAPVSITEWISGAYFCDADTPESTVQFLQYLQEHGIGLEVGVWDWTSGGFGSARWDFPSPKVSIFTGLSCHQKGYGLGKVVESW